MLLKEQENKHLNARSGIIRVALLNSDLSLYGQFMIRVALLQ